MKDQKSSQFFIGLSQFFQIPFNVLLVKILPFFMIRIYIYLLGFLYFALAHQQTLKIDKCLDYILKLSTKSPYSYLTYLKAYGGIFEHYYEKLLMAYKPLTIMFHYLGRRLRPNFHKDFLACIREGKGCILVTGHFGGVEYLPIAMNLQQIKIAMIVRFKSKQLRDALNAKAKKHDVHLIDADCPQVIYKAMEAIKKGRVLITECDEFSEWRPHKKNKHAVFGNQYPVDRTLDFFYKKAKVPAFLGLMQRDKGNFNLHIEPIADGNPKTSLAKNAWRRLEQRILRDPYQWYQWKSAYTLLERHILKTPLCDGAVRSSVEQSVHPTI